MMQITEDTPPDMLAGAMDLTVHLPNGHSVKMPVERSTPMMDLLVQVTTAHRLQPSGHIIEALGMAPTSSQRDTILPYKPNTPIGALDTQHIRVLAKGRTLPVVKTASTGHQPFESTFRLRVHLPRNQLYVFRVSQYIQLEDIMKKVCEEKNLDPVKYEFRHPANLDEVLNPKLSLSDYQITEICVVARGAVGLTQSLSSTDIMALRKEEERRQTHAKTGGGVFGLIFKRNRSGMGSGSISSENRSISPTHSDDSRSVTPPAVQPKLLPPQQEPNNKMQQDKPKPPQRKRRPAPKPPQMNDAKPKTEENPSTQKNVVDNGLTICHSRNSSDSSGYHEASILSDNLNTTLPRRPKSTLITNTLPEEKTPSEASGSIGNLSKMSGHSKSTSSLALAGRKKKAAPPPPLVKPASSIAASPEKPQPQPVVVASDPIVQPDSVSTLHTSDSPKRSISESVTPNTETHSLRSSISSTSLQTTTPPPVVEVAKEVEEKVAQKEKIAIFAPAVADVELDELDADWQYQLPSPPTAFRDASPTNMTEITNYETVTLNNFAPKSVESVISNPELFEKLQVVKDSQFETLSEDSTSKMFNSNLTLETLEKRKSLVYNRELSTSLKIAQNVETTKNTNDEITELEKLRTELAEAVQATNTVLMRHVTRKNSRAQERAAPVDSSLPNFMITTYDKPKQKLNIFEDDTIHSNSENTLKRQATITPADDINIQTEELVSDKEKQPEDVFKKPQEFVKSSKISSIPNQYAKTRRESLSNISRSESFSSDQIAPVWKPIVKVKRSKSQVTLQRYKDEVDADCTKPEGLHKANSLFDVSGLQSLEVMRQIQTQLGTQICSQKQVSAQSKSEDGPTPIPQKPTPTVTVPKPETAPKPSTSPSKYKYSGPPAINLGTWSERPKTQVSLKEDTDYKIKTTKLDVSSSTSNIEIKDSTTLSGYIGSSATNNGQNVTIKVNGSEAISRETSGNVLIKIGSNDQKIHQKEDIAARFINHITAAAYRKPLGNVNKIETSARPHSIAFGSDFDVNRLPIVRAVELKKTYKDCNNKSVTHIGPADPDVFTNVENGVNYGPKSLGSGLQLYKSSDNVSVQRNNSVYVNSDAVSRPVHRVNSYASNRPSPIVKGFRNSGEVSNGGEKPVAETWKMMNSYNTLPAKSAINNTHTNGASPHSDQPPKVVNFGNIFGNVVLRNTSQLNGGRHNYRHTMDGSNVNGKLNNNIPTPPPPMPKIMSFTRKTGTKKFDPQIDPREELLSAIRDFGGKKGLRGART